MALAAEEKPSAYLDVKLIPGQNKVMRSTHGDLDAMGDTTKQNVRKMAIAITAGTLMHSPLSAEVDWFFIAKDLATKKNYIFDGGTQQITIAAGGTQDLAEESKDLKSTVTQSTIYGMSELKRR